jgi:hypothetical protein
LPVFFLAACIAHRSCLLSRSGSLIALVTVKMVLHAAQVNAAFNKLEGVTYRRVFAVEVHCKTYIALCAPRKQVCGGLSVLLTWPIVVSLLPA